MRYVDGTDMRSLIGREGHLDPLYTAGIVGQIASALDAAHARGLVHRDVKPANILIAETPDGAFAYLTDFGLTKGVSAETSGLTKTGVFVGTLDYIAPEQLDGIATLRSDIYALGCLTYHALSGQVPYPQPTAPAKMWAHIHSPPPHLNIGVPVMADAVARAMAKNPDDRFGSAGEFGAALRGAVGGQALPDPAGVGPQLGQATVSEQRPILDTPLSNPEVTTGGDAPREAAKPASSGRATSRRPIAAAAALAILLLGGVTAAIVSSSGGTHKPKRTASQPAAHVVKLERHASPPVPQPRESPDAAAQRLKDTSPELGLESGRWERYGSGGVLEFKARNADPPLSPATYPMVLDREGRWVPTVKTPPGYSTLGHKRRDYSEPDTTAQAFVEDVRDRRCHDFWDVAETPGYGSHDRAAACRHYVDGVYARARAEFRAAKRVDVMRLGGTRELAFYGVRAGTSYRTLTLETAHGKSTAISMSPPDRGIPVPKKRS
jgi:serine/threonine-protein kinase